MIVPNFSLTATAPLFFCQTSSWKKGKERRRRKSLHSVKDVKVLRSVAERDLRSAVAVSKFSRSNLSLWFDERGSMKDIRATRGALDIEERETQ